MVSHKMWNFIIFGSAISLIIFGVLWRIYVPELTERIYEKELVLSPSSEAYSLWLHTPLPLYLDVYLFNWTNCDDFLKNKKIMPHFEEVGPFVFKEVHDRVNITWNNNHTVTYNQTRNWTFMPEESVNISTQITNLNVVAATLSQLPFSDPVRKKIISVSIGLFERLFVTSPARNWLFDGIDDPILDIMKDLPVFHNLFNMKKFGWFYGRNMSSSYDGIFTIDTGVKDVYNVGMMDKWNHMNKTYYFSDTCAMVNGTSGELFPPMRYPPNSTTVFISDICSSITLSRSESTVIQGIDSYNFIGDSYTLDNGQFVPENKCFCRDECAPYGARDVSRCRMGAPLYFSFPHFYLADDLYRKQISGMMPNKTEHEFFLQLDEVTGMPTNVRAQLQINLLLKTVPWIKMYKDVPKLYVPMMWFRQRAVIPPNLAQRLQLLRMIPLIMVGLSYAVLGLGILLFSVQLIVIIKRYSNKSSGELLIPRSIRADHTESDASEGEDENEG